MIVGIVKEVLFNEKRVAIMHLVCYNMSVTKRKGEKTSEKTFD